MKTVIEMAREAGFAIDVSTDPNSPPSWRGAGHGDRFKAFAELVRAEAIAEERSKQEHNHEVLMNALWKACGDDEQVVKDTIESQGTLL